MTDATQDRAAKHEAALKTENAIMDTFIGRTIVGAVWTDPMWESEWDDHGEYRLVLDDGRTLVFDSTGYDASDVHLRIEEPA